MIDIMKVLKDECTRGAEPSPLSREQTDRQTT